MKKRYLLVTCILIMILSLSGCESQKRKSDKKDDHLTVYVWDNNMIKDVVPYIREQIPDKDIEFIVGNNNVDLYNYLEKHNDLPDIITTRRFSAKDAEALQPYLLDLEAYDIVSEYYPYALQYYTGSDGAIKWLPVCGIPETIIANKTLFDKYDIKIPKNYKEFAECCTKLRKNGIKPYTSELAMDWAAHSLVQGAAIDEFSNIDGIEWRSSIESTSDDSAFKDDLWKKVFTEVNTFMKDTYLTKQDLEYDIDTAREKFVNEEAAMFRGTPSVMDNLKSNMNAELVRLPYFSQTSDESWIYTYPSFNVALNKNLEGNDEKLELAMKILNCFISEKGQKLVADGDGMISYNVHVESDFDGMTGVEEQVKDNAFYIRYASNGSFSGSLQSVNGLLSGQMDIEQAYGVFKKEVCNKSEKEPSIIDLKKQYDIKMNDQCGRDAASSILTTVRKSLNAKLAFSSYYYYTSSVYSGSCTETEARMMSANNDGTYLWSASLSGAQIKELIEKYLTGTEGEFRITNKYELPIASGMKLIVEPGESGFKLKDIEIDGSSIDNNEKYDILFTHEVEKLFKSVVPDQEPVNRDVMLTDAWVSALSSGQQPCEPEDYIKVEGNNQR